MSDLLLDRRRLVTVLLVDGPCAGTWTQVGAWGDEAWQRVGKGAQPEAQVWARYDHSLTAQGEYVYSGLCLTTDELGRAIKAHQDAGHIHGETRGA